MLDLVDFKNKHKGQDIYVIGSGPSCNFIDPSFFDNKITIGTNQTFRKYDTTYIVRKEHSLLQETIDNYKGIIFVSLGDCGTVSKKLNTDKYTGLDRVCMYAHFQNNLTIDLKAFDHLGHLCVSHSTITTSIHLAYHLGAKNILLVGVDHGTLDGKHTFDNYYKDIKESPWANWDQYKSWLRGIDNDTLKIKAKLSSLGVNIYSINPFINFSLEGHKYER